MSLTTVYEVPLSNVDTLVIDNYDSFTFNIVQYLEELGASVTVLRNDACSIDELICLNPSRIVISPGPGSPKSAGISNAIITHFAGRVPILGVCLGLQCIYESFGGLVTRAGEVVHGKASLMKNDGKGIFQGLPKEFNAVRYHSLAGTWSSLPDCLEVTCTSGDIQSIDNKSKQDDIVQNLHLIQGIRHKTLKALEGVQFHPESILTEYGHDLFKNWLKMKC
jgi:anthranilate synthase/indole-3-glycerol phosphate synthase/phosphoribosylanthranilate isomerase